MHYRVSKAHKNPLKGRGRRIEAISPYEAIQKFLERGDHMTLNESCEVWTETVGTPDRTFWKAEVRIQITRLGPREK